MPFLFVNKTLHSNLVTLTYRMFLLKYLIERRQEALVTVILCIRNVGVWWFSEIFRALRSSFGI